MLCPHKQHRSAHSSNTQRQLAHTIQNTKCRALTNCRKAAKFKATLTIQSKLYNVMSARDHAQVQGACTCLTLSYYSHVPIYHTSLYRKPQLIQVQGACTCTVQPIQWTLDLSKSRLTEGHCASTHHFHKLGYVVGYDCTQRAQSEVKCDQ